MSSLNDQIRNIIHSPESEAAARGEVDSRTPGSFPTDDMNAHTSDDINKDNSSHHHERNKLHKANDPRGNTFTQKSHGHSDSGVGIMDNSPHNERAATQEPVEQAYAPAAGEAQSSAVAGNHQTQDETAPGYDEKPEELGSTFGGATVRTEGNKQAEHPSNAVRSGKQKSTVDHPDPYWGNIEPGQQGHGVYNTVTGHGSKEDETRHHHDDNQRSFPLVGGAGHHTTQDSDPTRRNFDDTTSTGTSQPEKTTQEPAAQQEQKKSNWDGPVGAAVLGAAGTSTYAAGRDREQPRDDRQETTTEGDTPRDKAIPHRQDSSAANSETSSSKKRGIFGIFHRSEEEKEQRRLAKEQKKEEKLVSKEEERRLKAEGRRTERENEHVDPAATAAAATAMRQERQDQDNGERQFHEDGRRASWRAGDGPGVVHEDPRVQAPGPGARVARDIYNHKHPEEAQEGHPLEGFGPHERVKERQKHGSGTSTPQEGEVASSANQGQYNTLSSGTPSGVRTGSSDVSRKNVSEDRHSDRNRDAALAGTGAAGAGAAGYGAHKHHEDKKEREGREQPNTSTTTTTQNPDSHHGRDAALAGAGVGAAGYGAHKLHENRQDRDAQQQPDALTREQKDDGYNHLGTGTASGVRTDNTTSASTRDQHTTGDDSHHGRNAALAGTGLAGAGAAAYGAHEYNNRDKQNTEDVTGSEGRSHPNQSDSTVPIMAGTRHPVTEAYSSNNNPSSATDDNSNKRNIPAASDRTATTHIPSTTEEANEGHYNTLSTGTPSGINLDEHSHNQSKTSSDLPPVSESSNKGAYAAAGAGGLAAAGAGTAAYLNRKDSHPDELREGEREKVAEEEARIAKENEGRKESDCSATRMIGGGARNEKVTHTCTECGADQDISKYFNKSQ